MAWKKTTKSEYGDRNRCLVLLRSMELSFEVCCNGVSHLVYAKAPETEVAGKWSHASVFQTHATDVAAHIPELTIITWVSNGDDQSIYCYMNVGCFQPCCYQPKYGEARFNLEFNLLVVMNE